MRTTIIHSRKLTADAKEKIYGFLGGEFQQKSNCFLVQHDGKCGQENLLHLSQQLQIDINTLPSEYVAGKMGIFISDMDSTMISIECIDEIADFMNIKSQVSNITEAAMRGELDFESSLRRRVALLKELPSNVLEKVYQQRLNLNPGAEDLIAGLRNKNIKTALVSGGFSYFTERLQKRLQLDFQLANTLEIVNKQLTGKVLGDVIDADRKASYLQQLCEQLNISTKQTIAIGDGANDLKMLNKAGLGIAYHAKPVVQQQADVALNYSGLEAVLDFINID